MVAADWAQGIRSAAADLILGTCAMVGVMGAARLTTIVACARCVAQRCKRLFVLCGGACPRARWPARESAVWGDLVVRGCRWEANSVRQSSLSQCWSASVLSSGGRIPLCLLGLVCAVSGILRIGGLQILPAICCRNVSGRNV